MAKTSAAKSQSIYGVHPGVAMVQKSLADLKQKTGRSLEEWIALVKREAPKGEKERRDWLKTKHKLGMNSASWIAERAADQSYTCDPPPGRHVVLTFTLWRPQRPRIAPSDGRWTGHSGRFRCGAQGPVEPLAVH